MEEIGGYIQLEKYNLSMLHENAIALNCGRNCLAYIIRTRMIKKIMLPKFLCSSVREICIKEHLQVRYYSIGEDFLLDNVILQEDEWLYVVNYYGQLDNTKLGCIVEKYGRVIVDQAQAYFQEPIKDVDTLYSCRKFFGVPDGAFLYSDLKLEYELERDISYNRMGYLLGRFDENNASKFYGDYVDNNNRFNEEDIKHMSRLTSNLLHGIDYEWVKERRKQNFTYLFYELRSLNKLNIIIPEGPFMYPFYIQNGERVRERLQKKKIYIPILWPDVFECCEETELEYDMAKNILPLPVDQRYTLKQMKYIVDEVIG